MERRSVFSKKQRMGEFHPYRRRMEQYTDLKHPTQLFWMDLTNQVRNLQHEKEQVVQEQLTLDGHLAF